MKNRRNYYRLLHVQPEAPLEVIKASYRSMMTQLKGHPDLGGDHDAAVLLNEAYAVLSNAAKRREYDATLTKRRSVPPPEPAPAAAAGRARSAPLTHCPFCRSPVAAVRHCGHCSSPLALPTGVGARLRELMERRAMPRIAKTASLHLYPSWPHAGHPAHLRDLSPAGISLVTVYAARPDQVLKIDSSLLHGIVRVVSVRDHEAAWSVHASFLTIEFTTPTGGFVSERA